MTSAPCSRPSRKLKCALFLLCVLCAASLPAADPLWNLNTSILQSSKTTWPIGETEHALAAKEDPSWHLLVEPTFQHYETAWPIVGAEHTVLVPARVINGEILPLTRNEIVPLNATRQRILADAPASAAKILATLKPTYVRDDNGVIQYAILQSDNDLTASAVLAPGFSQMFADTLGPDILFAIPSRNKIYIFPHDTPPFHETGDIIVAEYESAGHSVSRELFKFVNGHLVAVGYFQ